MNKDPFEVTGKPPAPKRDWLREMIDRMDRKLKEDMRRMGYVFNPYDGEWERLPKKPKASAGDPYAVTVRKGGEGR